jgi:hypothetical protein
MLTIELENGPRVAIERVGVDAFAAAVHAAVEANTRSKNSSIPPIRNVWELFLSLDYHRRKGGVIMPRRGREA